MFSTDWKGYRVLAWIGQFLLAIAVVIEIARQNIEGSLTLAFFLGASIAFVVMADRLPALFDFLFVLAALLNAGGWVWNLFNQPGPYDEIAHAFTTFSITLALSFLVYGSMLTMFHQHAIAYILIIASFGIAIGAIWEIFEWLIQVINDLDDTIIDLLMNSIGALMAAILSWFILQDRINKTVEN